MSGGAPPHPASQRHAPGLTHEPWPPQPLGQTGVSQSMPDHPGLHTHIGDAGCCESGARVGESAQWPWPEHADAPQYGCEQSSPCMYGLVHTQPRSVHMPWQLEGQARSSQRTPVHPAWHSQRATAAAPNSAAAEEAGDVASDVLAAATEVTTHAPFAQPCLQIGSSQAAPRQP